MKDLLEQLMKLDEAPVKPGTKRYFIQTKEAGET